MRWNWNLDGWIVLAGVLAAVSAALLGNFFVLRRMSMLGDAIIVAYLYRCEERKLPATVVAAELSQKLHSSSWSTHWAIKWLHRRGEIADSSAGFKLTDLGRDHARSVVRSHRLWEQYLSSQASVGRDRLHGKAEQLEHFTDRQLREQLDREMDVPSHDPHGTAIPVEKREGP